VRWLLFCLLITSCWAQNGPSVNPATQVRWPKITGSGAPTGPCLSVNYGTPYVDTSAGTQYVCSSGGWVTVTGSANAVSIQGNAVVSGVPANGQSYYWNSSASQFQLDSFLRSSGGVLTGTLTLPNLVFTASQSASLFMASPSGGSGVPAWRAIAAADVPTLNQNTSGTASGLSGTQTANLVYAAPNGSAGLALFRSLVAADLPSISVTTTGSGGAATFNMGTLTFNVPRYDQYMSLTTTGSNCAGATYASGVLNIPPCSGTGGGVTSLNGATGAFTFQPSPWINYAANVFTVKTQRGNDAVVDWGFDPSGTISATNVTAFGNYLAAVNTIGAPGLKFPCGNYYFSSTIHITQKFISLTGDNTASNGKTTGCVTFQTDTAGPILWLDGLSNPLAGAALEHIQFYDSSSGHNTLMEAVRVTDEEHNLVYDASGWDIQGVAYNSGADTIAVVQGSTAVVGTGTSFDTNCAAVDAPSSSPTTVYPCFLVVKDSTTGTSWPYEIASVTDSTHLTTAIQHIGASQSGVGYSLHKGGVLFWHDPGPTSGNANQYSNYFVVNTQSVWMTHYIASTSSAVRVNSRINFWGGWNNTNGVGQDQIFAYCGHYCDTMNFIGVAANGHAFGIVIADGHQNTVAFTRFENTAAPSVPTYGTCTGAGFPCSKGLVVMSDNASDTYGNQVVSNYFRQMGNGVEFAGIAGQTPTQSRIFGNTFRTNTTNCVGVFNIATNTYGECDGDAALKSLVIGGGTNVQYRCSGGTNDGAIAWKTAYCVVGGGSAVATSLTVN
jgi:hypothetical protein